MFVISIVVSVCASFEDLFYKSLSISSACREHVSVLFTKYVGLRLVLESHEGSREQRLRKSKLIYFLHML